MAGFITGKVDPLVDLSEFDGEDDFRWSFGGGKGGGGSASTPDPAATAAAQGQANKEAVYESARVNQTGTSGPGGKTYWTGEIGAPDRTLVTELSPGSQTQYNQREQIGTTLGGYGQQLANQVAQGPAQFSLDGLPAAPWEQDYSAQAKSLEDATYQRGLNLLQPQYDRQRTDLETKLANQGITQGSEAYTKAMGDLSDTQNRALTDLGLASVSAGRAEQSRLYGLNSQGRNQALNELLTERTQPMNELSALLQGTPALATPTSNSGGNYQVQPADVMGAANLAYQGALNSAQMKQQQQQAGISNLLGAGGLGLAAYTAFSDRRLKRDIERVGTLPNGLAVYEYRYVWGAKRYRGVMAQDVLDVIPDAVVRVGEWLAVDYSKIMEAA